MTSLDEAIMRLADALFELANAITEAEKKLIEVSAELEIARIQRRNNEKT